jgi:S-phase entry cyclin 5/6
MIEFLLYAGRHFNCLPETVHLAVYMLDRFLQTNRITYLNTQLLVITALFIAVKQVWARSLPSLRKKIP